MVKEGVKGAWKNHLECLMNENTVKEAMYLNVYIKRKSIRREKKIAIEK